MLYKVDDCCCISCDSFDGVIIDFTHSLLLTPVDDGCVVVVIIVDDDEDGGGGGGSNNNDGDDDDENLLTALAVECVLKAFIL